MEIKGGEFHDWILTLNAAVVQEPCEPQKTYFNTRRTDRKQSARAIWILYGPVLVQLAVVDTSSL